MSADPLDLSGALRRFMELYRDARTEPFSHDHPAFEALQVCARLISEVLPPALRGAEVRPSVGQGNWASVPWIAVLYPEETTTTQRGIYPVLLFDESADAVEVTLAQGVTELKRELGRADAVRVMRQRAERLLSMLENYPLVRQGFRLDNNFTLGSSSLAKDYVASTIVHRRYTTDSLLRAEPDRPLRTLLGMYSQYVGDLSKAINSPSVDARAAILYPEQSAQLDTRVGGEATFRVNNYLRRSQFEAGDLVLIGAGLYTERHGRRDGHSLRDVAIGRLVGASAHQLTVEVVGREHDVFLSAPDFGAKVCDAIERTASLPGSVESAPVLGSLLLESAYNGEVLDPTPVPVPDPPPAPLAPPLDPPTFAEAAAATQAFVDAVEASGLLFGEGEVRAYIAAVLTKPFTILTGLSGSGKTQLALRTGEWFGRDQAGRKRYLVIPVRPDWTGPEYLFGYQDALRSTQGENVWAVPDALEFMQQAREEPDAPHLLVLDEMNLAHVERYFADFLSGIESDEGVLPEVKRVGEEWHATGNSQRLPIPPNLFVVGTVNVDETTYQFSPKVLDRAFTFEFRTASNQLNANANKPRRIDAADDDHLAAVVGLSRDDAWHRNNPHPDAEDLAGELVRLHEKLTETNYEFGHRVLQEAMRYAAVLATDPADTEHVNGVLDLIVLTKILPKIHGTRARVEQTLVDLREFAAPQLTLSVRKLDRMLKVVREAQFVSFTE